MTTCDIGNNTVSSRRTIQELKSKFESNAFSAYEILPLSPELSRLRTLKKSIVKQLVSMYSSRMSQVSESYSESGETSSCVNDLPSDSDFESEYSTPKTQMPCLRSMSKTSATMDNSGIAEITRYYTADEGNSYSVNDFPSSDKHEAMRLTPKTSVTSPDCKSKANTSKKITRKALMKMFYSDEDRSNYTNDFAPYDETRFSLPNSFAACLRNKSRTSTSVYHPRLSEITKRYSYAEPLQAPRSPLSNPKSISKACASASQNCRIGKPKAPMPSPCSSTSKTQFCVSEEDFGKLTVKKKAELYTRFASDMLDTDPHFYKQAEKMRANIIGEEIRSEVIHEKQESVKFLLEELEAKSSVPQQTDPPKRNPVKRFTKRSTKLKEVGDKSESKISFDLEPSNSENDRLFSCPTPLPEQALKTNFSNQQCHKRRNNEMRSCLPADAYAPPKKIRRSHSERLFPSLRLNAWQIKRLFFNWLKEKKEKAKAEKVELNKFLDESITMLQHFKFDEGERNTTPIAAPAEAGSKACPFAFGKTLETEVSASGLSSLSKIVSDAPGKEADYCGKCAEFARPFKLTRKKKSRRTVAGVKYTPFQKPYPINSTDSDTDYRLAAKNTIFFPQPEATFKWPNAIKTEEFNKNLESDTNSPQEVKSACSLNESSPTPYQQEEGTLNNSPSPTGNWSCPKRLNDKTLSLDVSHGATRKKPNIGSPIDQGFETGSNYTDSSRPASKLSGLIKLSPDKSQGNLFNFSTPLKTNMQPAANFHNNSSIHREQASPITMPRPSSLAMQAMQKGQQKHETISPLKINQSEQRLYANAHPNPATSTNISVLGEISKFWIKAGEFLILHDICFTDTERLRLLYEVFSETSCGSKNLNFGIDNLKFSMQNVCEQENITKRFPANGRFSYYWFSTGDFIIPFIGLYLSADKIKRLFGFVRASAEETGILMFGVDAVVFSNVCQLWNQSPSFSMDSSYGMLVGLQSGNSNGLEGRNKFAWPNTKFRKVSDLDKSDNQCNSFEDNDSHRLSRSPVDFNQLDLAALSLEDTSLLRNNEAIMNRQSFGMKYENEPIDNLFDRKQTPVPQIAHTLLTQEQPSNVIQDENLLKYNINNTRDVSSDASQTHPDYCNKLKSIIKEISHKGLDNGFKDCTVQQLETYVITLSRCAGIYLQNKTDHMQKVQDLLLSKK